MDNVYLVHPPAELAWIRVVTPAVAAAENGGDAEIQLERRGNVDLSVDVRFATQDSGAVGGVDYEPRRGTLTFAPGETQKSLRVPVLDNSIPDPLRSFGVWLLDAGANGVFIGTPFAGVSIRDDESEVALEPLVSTLPPGTNAVVAQVQRRGDLTLPRVVGVELVPQTAALNIAFTMTGLSTNQGWVFFDVGASVGAPRLNQGPGFSRREDPLAVSTDSSAAAEGPETFLVRLTPSADLRVAGQNELPIRIARAPAPPRLEVLPPAPGGALRLSLTLETGSIGRLEVSEDLSQWQLVRVVESSGVVTLTQPVKPAEFFRVVIP